jgi:predicted kinase
MAQQNNTYIILIGVSGSGKSTWSKQFIKDNANYVRINRDDIRRVLVGDLVSYYTREDVNSLEGIVTDISFELLDLCTFKNKNIIIDNTNLTQAYIKIWLGQFKNHSRITDIQFKLFDCELIEAKSRVYQRDYLFTNDPNKVDYIDKQYQQYQSIKKWILETYPDNIIK